MTRYESESIIWAKDYARFANQRAEIYGDNELSNMFLMHMNKYERQKFKDAIVAMQHPLSFQPGSQEWRFVEFCKQERQGER